MKLEIAIAASKLPKVLPTPGKDWPAHKKIRDIDYHLKQAEYHEKAMQQAVRKNQMDKAGDHAEWRDKHNYEASVLLDKRRRDERAKARKGMQSTSGARFGDDWNAHRVIQDPHHHKKQSSKHRQAARNMLVLLKKKDPEITRLLSELEALKHGSPSKYDAAMREYRKYMEKHHAREYNKLQEHERWAFRHEGMFPSGNDHTLLRQQALAASRRSSKKGNSMKINVAIAASAGAKDLTKRARDLAKGSKGHVLFGDTPVYEQNKRYDAKNFLFDLSMDSLALDSDNEMEDAQLVLTFFSKGDSVVAQYEINTGGPVTEGQDVTKILPVDQVEKLIENMSKKNKVPQKDYTKMLGHLRALNGGDAALASDRPQRDEDSLTLKPGAKKHPAYSDAVQELKDDGIDPKSARGIAKINKAIDDYDQAEGGDDVEQTKPAGKRAATEDAAAARKMRTKG